MDNVNDALAYYIALKNAGVPVEMHLYAHGEHAFGLRRTKLPITEWPRLVETWLGTIGMISESVPWIAYGEAGLGVGTRGQGTGTAAFLLCPRGVRFGVCLDTECR